MDEMLTPLTIKYKAGAVYGFRFKNSKWQVKCISWLVRWREVLSSTPSNHWVLSSKGISCRANSHGVTCPNNCIFPLDSSGPSHSRKIKPTFGCKEKAAQIMNPWTEIRFMHKAQNFYLLAWTQLSLSSHTKWQKGRDDGSKMLYAHFSQGFQVLCTDRRSYVPGTFPSWLNDL